MALPARSDSNAVQNEAAGFETVCPDVSARAVPASDMLTQKDITNPREAFLHFISPHEYQVTNMRALPRPRTVWLTPGIGHVGPKGELVNMLNTQASEGRTMVPPDIEVEAWGKIVKGIVRPHKITNGHVHHTTVWERFKRIGSKVHWERDEEGYLKYLEILHGLLGGDVEPVIVEKALTSIRAEIDYLRTRPPYDAVAQERLAYLRGLHPNLTQPKEAAKKPRRGRKPKASAD